MTPDVTTIVVSPSSGSVGHRVAADLPNQPGPSQASCECGWTAMAPDGHTLGAKVLDHWQLVSA